MGACFPKLVNMDGIEWPSDEMVPGGERDQSGESDPNVQFYRNQIASQDSFGNGALIDTMHGSWDGNYEKLESEHGYIQWIFPLFECSAFNGESVPLSA